MTNPAIMSEPMGKDADQAVTILGVDPANFVATGVTRDRRPVTIDLRYHIGAVHVIPVKDDQWMVRRFGATWILVSQLPHNTTELLTVVDNPVPGMTQIGNTNPAGQGPIELNGTQVNINSAYMKIGNLLYRSNNGNLEYSPADADPLLWTVVSNGPGVDADGFYILAGVTLDADDFYDPYVLMISGAFDV